MDFDFSDEQKQLRETARRFLAERCPMEAVRKVLDGEAAYDAGLWRALGEMGFLGAAIPEAHGGLGAGYLELCVIAEEMGRSLAPVPMASSIYLAAEFLKAAGSEAQKATWLPKLASGEAVGAFALAEGPGRISASRIKAGVSGGKLTGTKLPVADGHVADVAVVATKGANGALSLYLVELDGPGVERELLESIDPTQGQARLTFQGAAAEPLGAAGQGSQIIAEVYDRAAVLLAFEQIGGAERALEMGRDYALERMAFGRQIGAFQAIKHMLADMYVSLALARANAYYAAWALAAGAPQLKIAAPMARVSATTAFQHCAKNNIQAHGGMGFTWAFDCHLYYRRSNGLAAVLGSLSTWQDLLISRMAELNDLGAAA